MPLTISLHHGPLPADLLDRLAELEALTLADEAALWGTTGLAATLAAPHAAVSVLGPADDPAAYCLFTCVAAECEVLQIATHPARQRQGLAQRLLLAVLNHAANTGCERALLEVRAGNVAARTLYERLGFQTDGRRRAYYPAKASLPDSNPADRDALLMSRPLPLARP